MADALPNLSELLERALQSRLGDVHVSMPGVVVSYDPATQTATVQPALRRTVFDENDEPIPEEIPPIVNVPVSWPGGAGLTIHGVLAHGDTGDLVFSTWSHNEWQATGQVSTPGDLKLHGLGGAKFYPGIRSKANAAPDTDNSIGSPGGLRIHFGSTVNVGAGAQFVAIASLVLAELVKIQAALLTGSNSGGPVVFATAYAAPSTVASSNLKADP